jgi:hypothetical protein
MKHMKILLTTILCCVAGVSAAHAHAFLDHADPKVGSTVTAAPKEIKIWYTERLVLPFSDIKLADASGQAIATSNKHLDPSNEQLLIVSVPALKPGKYAVSWRVTAVDTHVTHGTFTFTVSP